MFPPAIPVQQDQMDGESTRHLLLEWEQVMVEILTVSGILTDLDMVPATTDLVRI